MQIGEVAPVLDISRQTRPDTISLSVGSEGEENEWMDEDGEMHRTRHKFCALVLFLVLLGKDA